MPRFVAVQFAAKFELLSGSVNKQVNLAYQPILSKFPVESNF